MKSALAIRHVLFEDLGAFAPALEAAGYPLRYLDVGGDAGRQELRDLSPQRDDLVIALGGPIGVYEEETYPFLKEEIAFLQQRLACGAPLMGICLGAQLIARAAGARVYPSGVKEIGFAPVSLTAAGTASCLAPFAAAPTTLHWHGDTFDLPEGAELLASTAACPNQAFALGRKVIGFQFHPEADCSTLEHWLIGHTVELAAAGIDVPGLRRDAETYEEELRGKAAAVMATWLGGLEG